MDEEKRKTLARVIVLVLIFIAAIFYFLWGNYLNRGKVSIAAKAPFNVEIYEGETFSCDVSPCVITQKIGEKNLILTKEGYESTLQKVDFKLWRTVDLAVKFKIIPYIEKVTEIPRLTSKINYGLLLDETNGMYKLVNLVDQTRKAIVYFQKKINNPQILGGLSSVLVIGETGGNLTAYRVNISEKTRTQIPDFNFKIIGGKWSDDGKNFVFSKTDSPYLWLLDSKNKISQLSLSTNDTKYDWIASGNLAYITKQDTSFMFGQYDPTKNSYTDIKSFSEITSLPEIFIPASNGQVIYFQISDQKYKLIAG